MPSWLAKRFIVIKNGLSNLISKKSDTTSNNNNNNNNYNNNNIDVDDNNNNNNNNNNNINNDNVIINIKNDLTTTKTSTASASSSSSYNNRWDRNAKNSLRDYSKCSDHSYYDDNKYSYNNSPYFRRHNKKYYGHHESGGGGGGGGGDIATVDSNNNNNNNNNNQIKEESLQRVLGPQIIQTHCDENDSRIHSAMVSKINMATRSVTVEWYERGETKGKEIELDHIIQLNTELSQEQAASMPKIIKQTTSHPLSRNPTHGAIRVSKQNNSNIPTNGHRTTRGIIGNATAAAAATARMSLAQAPPAAAPPPPAAAAPPPAPPPSSTTTQNNNQVQSTPVTNQAANARRSYVVKEVERLKENREKRRARQAEIKEEKVALMNMDPGNPNWELSAMIRDYQRNIEFRPLVDGLPVEDHQITVCVRKRPVSRKEVMKKELDVISVPSKDQLIVHEPKSKVDLTKYLENHKFRYDYAFDDNCSNEIVYKYTAKPLVKTIFEGGMATCFAYGQTGAGKTHTMGGQFNGKIQDCKNGIYAMAAKDVFTLLHGSSYRHLNLVVSSSFFEIYSGKVFDLLSDKQKLRVLEDGKQQVQVVGLTEKVVDNVDEVLKIIQHGNSTRTSGQTSANSNSSRSHAVFQIVLRPPGSHRIHGKFSFIDLAGNERGADTSSSDRQTRMEGAEINKSLLALKECIRALGRQNAHLPFRVSKLTQVLRDSFIGDKSKTCMIAMISPGLSSCEHTLNTLRYANRVKELVVQDPETRTDDIERMDSDDNNKNGLNQNELSHLRSLSEHDMSDDLLNQHAAISDIQQAEELLVDQHKAINEFLAVFLPESQNLHSTTNYVEYDQDAYCKRGEEMFTQLTDLAANCRNLIVDFRAKLANEEMISHNVLNPGKR